MDASWRKTAHNGGLTTVWLSDELREAAERAPITPHATPGVASQFYCSYPFISDLPLCSP